MDGRSVSNNLTCLACRPAGWLAGWAAAVGRSVALCRVHAMPAAASSGVACCLPAGEPQEVAAADQQEQVGAEPTGPKPLHVHPATATLPIPDSTQLNIVHLLRCWARTAGLRRWCLSPELLQLAASTPLSHPSKPMPSLPGPPPPRGVCAANSWLPPTACARCWWWRALPPP